MAVKRGLAAKAHDSGFTNVIELDAWGDHRPGPGPDYHHAGQAQGPEATFVLQVAGNRGFIGADTMRIRVSSTVALCSDLRFRPSCFGSG